MTRPDSTTLSATPTRTRRPRGLRWWLREIHLWSGLILCAPLVVLGLSGSYLVYHDTFDRWLGDAPQFDVTAGPSRSAGEIVAAALADAPAGYEMNLLFLPSQEGEPATVRVGPAGTSFRDPNVISKVVDPVSLVVIGTVKGGLSPLTRIMHDLHGHLMISGGNGRAIVGWLGVVMLFLGISGLVIWWPATGRLVAALTIKRGARGYRLQRDLHGAVGFWTLSVFVIVSFTGVWIVFPQTLTGAVGLFMASGEGPQGRPVAGAPVSDATPASVDRLAELAKSAVPDASPTAIIMPFRPGQPARVRMTYPGAADGAPAINVSIDPWQGRIIETRDPRRLAPIDAIGAWQRPLHEGGGLGPVWRAAIFVSGLLPLLFGVTGVTMWLIKRRARRNRLRA